MWSFVLPAITFGLVAGLKPGPLGIYIIQQTLIKGVRSGAAASLAPIITDFPIILVVHVILSSFKNSGWVVALISFLGGCNLLFLARKTYRSSAKRVALDTEYAGSLWEAVKINFLNPSPYLFWATIGGSYIAIGTPAQAGAFIFFSISFLVLTKMGVALSFLYFRDFLKTHAYILTMKFLAILMVGFGIQLFWTGYQLI